ncbi:DNA cytosine methyltransferase [Amycolatopsis sp. K13G38]|uniref:DNA (cytosine-5-)-methyltransferase n=1 Tax=Amycolatopsis acididurans TaxID=2724524 RepID=A0ABX1J7J1_9PSEU|nr:DNA (cytosine-5-)-methyltransferase [Amycolatopsis acididurans]NKQ54410.1 DNA cytosine methyltransferase [Amycolatopsis acididurans]
MSSTEHIVEGFAGPGGWSHGLRLAGYRGRVSAFEIDANACATARAAGHHRTRADVAALDPAALGPVTGVVMSPPCQAFSTAGKRAGERDKPAVFARMTAFARGRTPREHGWADERSKLTAEPLRYVHALRPRWVALEQVPPVLPLWRHAAQLLRELGYRAWCGILAAECYGVPQTRRRAILIARRDGLPVEPPAPTHQEYRSGHVAETEPDLFGDPLPAPVSMADALGWGLPVRPAWTVTAGGTDSGGAEVFGNHAARQHLHQVTVSTGNNSRVGRGRTVPYERGCAAPSPTLTGNVAAWALRSNYSDGGDAGTRTIREPGEPATTITGKVGHWVMRNGSQDNACARTLDEPAGTVFFGQRANAVEFVEFDGQGRRRVTVAEAGLLQGFPPDYPWQGTKSAQYRQVGDAVPPPLAAAILAPLIGHQPQTTPTEEAA